MKWLIVVAVVMVVAGARCPKAADDYYPLSVGNAWDTEGYVLFGTTAAALDTMPDVHGADKDRAEHPAQRRR